MSTSFQQLTAQLAQQFSVSVDQAAAALQDFGQRVGSPQEELRWRLNERLQGRDPGKPVHWRGL